MAMQVIIPIYKRGQILQSVILLTMCIPAHILSEDNEIMKRISFLLDWPKYAKVQNMT